MRGVLTIIVAAAFLIGFGSAVYGIHEIVPSETQIPEPGPDAVKLNEYIVKYKPYTAWNLWPGKGKLYKATAHGELLTTFVNDTAYHSVKDKKGMTDGSIIVKESYTADKRFTGITVMYKLRGYNPEAGDWFWAKYAPDGNVLASGKVKACIDCHAQKKDNDYVMTGEVKK